MVSFVEIKKSIIELLKSTNIPVIAEEIKDSIEKYKPCFFIQMTSVGVSYDETVVTVYIHYFPKGKTNIELLEMVDKLNSIFSMSVLEGLEIQDIRTDMSDGILRYTFDLSVKEFKGYYEDEATDNYELMQHLHINKEEI
ncbi:MAG: hypothetical protein E6970_01415 [Peptostreptococcus sp.]|uniref:phage tail terminator family protein n=1 Tax=Peptostreptococcus TaxID=1257 RepID=UPI00232C2F6D|nr:MULTISPECIES: hypothetical protein [Peptostreptococcus]MDB8821752.1 hypothetical protein [Peptostreptococcus anaerobius]MDB8826381.1 hypothetical protein [Peptostreptococcus anaerobius]MDB8828207.1 hypothetical protein [Peptostreptococcus anaerobius]MDB8829953.1 hypothetical protein [Peptostreptococcus anaerobius]MDB8831858.1 hypothetical protein [Peptostreptococcus anaerobius]